MLISGKRKDVQDNNNYIKKYGTITHVCPNCGNLYTNGIKLSVNCTIMSDCDCELESYVIQTPEIDKVCICGKKALQVDNAMGIIVKTLIDKGYTVKACCEGHVYIKNEIPSYDFPFIIVEGKIKSLIPSSYYKKFNIDSNFEKTVISCTDNCECPCICIEKFLEYKEDILGMMYNLVNALPNCPFTNDEPKSYCNCDSSCYCG